MGRLDGQVAIVTGAARGIGQALARGLAREGAAVVCADVDDRELAATVDGIARAGGRAAAVRADVRRSEDAQRLVEEALSRFGQLDILCNIAGIYPRSSVVEMDEAEWNAVLDTNLKGTFLCSRAAARAMIPRRRGRIVSVASGRAALGDPRGAHYAASKAGIIAFSKSLALELAPHGITVNVLGPGLTDTRQPRVAMTEEQLQVAARKIPLGRIGQPEDLVGAAVFLCSEESAFVTGATLWVNGGSVMV